MNLTPTFLDDFDAEKIISEADASNSRVVKRDLIKRGLVYQISFWGAVTTKSTDKTEARRYEFFSDTPFYDHDIYVIKRVMVEIRPPYSYSIWEYNRKKNAIRVVKHYDPRTY